MALSIGSSSWPAFTQATSACNPNASPSVILDFFTSIGACDIDVFDERSFKRPSIIGSGGFAIVERVNGRDAGTWRDFPELCVMKRGRKSLATDEGFERLIRHTYLEARILSHKPLRTHPHIVDILGICMNEELDYPSFSLVLEYAPHGSLKEFLRGRCEELSENTLVALLAQVANGLEAVHNCKICHGDVKIDNVLIFQVKGLWTAKISDFNSSLVGRPDDLSAPVDCEFGTRLRNAPEVRHMSAFSYQHSDIATAILTDVYSFGLLIWEVLKKGQNYFESHWRDLGSDQVDEDLIETYINTLPADGLLLHALDFVNNTIMCEDISACVSTALIGSLQHDPTKRLPMLQLRQCLQGTNDTHYTDDKALPSVNSETLLELGSWSTQNSFFEAVEALQTHAERLVSADSLPPNIRERIVAQIKGLSESVDCTDSSRSHAAFCVAECYAIGFGVPLNGVEVVHWILKAAELGSQKAISWYPRLCSAAGIVLKSSAFTSPFIGFEEELNRCSTEEYLISRIRLQRDILVEQLKIQVTRLPEGLQGSPNEPITAINLFNSWEPDHLLPIHAAALLGDDDAMRQMIHESEVELCTSRGLKTIHYACIGGHISTLELILSYSKDIGSPHIWKLSPLHFCIFFDSDSVTRAIDTLLLRGADPHTQTEEYTLSWEYHDILLYGSALEWAVLSRNRLVVNALLPFTRDYKCLKAAVDCSYWEIVEDILKHFETRTNVCKDLWYLYFKPRPFSHWIAHGTDHNIAIQQTAELLNRYKYGFDQFYDPDDYEVPDILPGLFDQITTEAQLVHLEAWINLLPNARLKHPRVYIDQGQETALSVAISSATDHELWVSIIQKLVHLYTIEELQENALIHGSYLHDAVFRDCVVGARVLLEQGVDVNQRGFNAAGDTPLHICLTQGNSEELFNLLLKHGADTTAESMSTLQITPYESLFISSRYKPRAVSLVLEDCRNSSEFTKLVSMTFLMQLQTQDQGRREYFHSLLRSPRMAESINELNDYNATMLHLAAFSLDSVSVKVLLDAGADAGLRGGREPDSFLPLQIACTIGRSLWSTTPTNPTLLRYRESAMEVASDLLCWHHVQCDGLFRGITKLHLACRMNIEEEVRKLLSIGFDRNAKGTWPELAYEVSPQQLQEMDLEGLPSLFPRDEEEESRVGALFPFDDAEFSLTQARISNLLKDT